MGTLLISVYLFVVLVMLLNILIAQLSDIYNLLRTDAQIEVDINRAWIVAKVELNTWNGLIYKHVRSRCMPARLTVRLC